MQIGFQSKNMVSYVVPVLLLMMVLGAWTSDAGPAEMPPPDDDASLTQEGPMRAVDGSHIPDSRGELYHYFKALIQKEMENEEAEEEDEEAENNLANLEKSRESEEASNNEDPKRSHLNPHGLQAEMDEPDDEDLGIHEAERRALNEPFKPTAEELARAHMYFNKAGMMKASDSLPKRNRETLAEALNGFRKRLVKSPTLREMYPKRRVSAEHHEPRQASYNKALMADFPRAERRTPFGTYPERTHIPPPSRRRGRVLPSHLRPGYYTGQMPPPSRRSSPSEYVYHDEEVYEPDEKRFDDNFDYGDLYKRSDWAPRYKRSIITDKEVIAEAAKPIEPSSKRASSRRRRSVGDHEAVRNLMSAPMSHVEQEDHLNHPNPKREAWYELPEVATPEGDKREDEDAENHQRVQAEAKEMQGTNRLHDEADKRSHEEGLNRFHSDMPPPSRRSSPSEYVYNGDKVYEPEKKKWDDNFDYGQKKWDDNFDYGEKKWDDNFDYGEKKWDDNFDYGEKRLHENSNVHEEANNGNHEGFHDDPKRAESQTVEKIEAFMKNHPRMAKLLEREEERMVQEHHNKQENPEHEQNVVDTEHLKRNQFVQLPYYVEEEGHKDGSQADQGHSPKDQLNHLEPIEHAAYVDKPGERRQYLEQLAKRNHEHEPRSYESEEEKRNHEHEPRSFEDEEEKRNPHAHERASFEDEEEKRNPHAHERASFEDEEEKRNPHAHERTNFEDEEKRNPHAHERTSFEDEEEKRNPHAHERTSFEQEEKRNPHAHERTSFEDEEEKRNGHEHERTSFEGKEEKRNTHAHERTSFEGKEEKRNPHAHERTSFEQEEEKRNPHAHERASFEDEEEKRNPHAHERASFEDEEEKRNPHAHERASFEDEEEKRNPHAHEKASFEDEEEKRNPHAHERNRFEDEEEKRTGHKHAEWHEEKRQPEFVPGDQHHLEKLEVQMRRHMDSEPESDEKRNGHHASAHDHVENDPKRTDHAAVNGPDDMDTYEQELMKFSGRPKEENKLDKKRHHIDEAFEQAANQHQLHREDENKRNYGHLLHHEEESEKLNKEQHSEKRNEETMEGHQENEAGHPQEAIQPMSADELRQDMDGHPLSEEEVHKLEELNEEMEEGKVNIEDVEEGKVNLEDVEEGKVKLEDMQEPEKSKKSIYHYLPDNFRQDE